MLGLLLAIGAGALAGRGPALERGAAPAPGEAPPVAAFPPGSSLGPPPDPKVVGKGFCARLSGSTAEFCHMLLLMFMGDKPFSVVDGELKFEPRPVLPGWMYSSESVSRPVQVNQLSTMETFESGTSAMMLFGQTFLVFHKAAGNSGSLKPCSVKNWQLFGRDGSEQKVDGPALKGEFASDFRAGAFRRVDAWL